jgi:predicted RNase H-like HicB family nuclease
MSDALTDTIVIEKSPRNYSAYAPDIPGCVATGKTLRELINNMADAIEFHFDGLREDGLPIPESTTIATTLHAHLSAIGSKSGKATAARMTEEERHARAVKAGSAGGRGRQRFEKAVDTISVATKVRRVAEPNRGHRKGTTSAVKAK